MKTKIPMNETIRIHRRADELSDFGAHPGILSIKNNAQLRDSLRNIEVPSGGHLFDALLSTGLWKSKGEIKNNLSSVYIDGLKMEDWVSEDFDKPYIIDKTGYTLVYRGKNAPDLVIIHFI